ncbi:MAG TPA: class I SAM-dependent methyltransferase [Gaiellaceae bacterium]|nr:class I SAM-dependent methyltransferase [Gaiellaceae bacterium]
MSGFFTSTSAYDRFMGRFSQPLGPLFADFAGVAAPGRALDVGCGPGALTAELAARLGAANVAAIDASEAFVEAARERNPGVDVRHAPAEAIPFADDTFDFALAQLVVHFMADAVAGLREMARVARPGGVVAACVWDHHGGRGPLSPFWTALEEFDPAAESESDLAGSRDGHLGELFRDAGLADVHESSLSVGVEFESFEEWWAPYELGVGPAGAYVATLDDTRREELRELCRTRMPQAPFTVTGKAWAARGSRPAAPS